MDATAVLKVMRRRLGEVAAILGESSPTWDDDYLMEYVQGAALLHEAKDIGTDYTVVVDPASLDPEPNVVEGMLLALKAAADLLGGDLTFKVAAGDLGVRFRTGLEEISTVEASRRISEVASKAEGEYRSLLTHYLSGNTTASRIQ